MERANEKDHDFFYWRLIGASPYPITLLATEDKQLPATQRERKEK
jgi:hypothetical protein